MRKFKIQTYTIRTSKIDHPFTFVVFSDLHGCEYGKKQQGLLDLLPRLCPDAVWMTGDMSDIRGSEEPFWDFIAGAVKQAPCYYVTGNHEYHGHCKSSFRYSPKEIRQRKDSLREQGVHVLEGEKQILAGSNSRIAVMGIDDLFVGRKQWDQQYQRCCRETDQQQYTVLLSHRPEPAGAYRYFPGDLVVCGHAHGGQWRLPGIRGGVYAPGQGLFPRYAGGLYERGTAHLLVSCGLCYRYPRIPRFGNPPEVVVLRLEPEEES